MQDTIRRNETPEEEEFAKIDAPENPEFEDENYDSMLYDQWL